MGEHVVFCPKCLSTQVSRELSLRSYGEGSFFNMRRCRDCDYRSIFPSAHRAALEQLRREHPPGPLV